MLGSTFCPLVSNVYIFFVNFLNVVTCKGCKALIPCVEKCQKSEIKDQIPNKNGEKDISRTEDVNIGIVGEPIENVGIENVNLEICDEQSKHTGNEEICKGEINENVNDISKTESCKNFWLQSFSHGITIFLLVLMYKLSFNIFFCGLSYVIQFFIFTLLLAVPHFPIQYYVYIIFFTSVIIYISRFVFQFIKLYRNLLETILEIQEQTSIPINHFDRIVAKHFPLSNELFYLLVKIMLSGLFFAIIYDTMQNVGYIRFGAQPDLTTIISLIFLFGPPRIVEAMLVRDFTSRVHMKEKEIKDELVKIKAEKDTKRSKSNKTMSILHAVLTEEERELTSVKKCIECWRKVRPGEAYTTEEKTPGCCLCIFSLLCCGCCNFAFDDKGNSKCCVKLKKKSKTKKRFEEESTTSKEETSTSEEETSEKPTNNRCNYVPDCFWCRWLGMFFCGCCNFPLDDEGNCKCCVILTTNAKSNKTTDSSEEHYKIPCLCVKDCLNKDTGENPEEKMNLFNELKTDTLYKITVDTVDEIRPRIIYNAKAEIINDGIIELEKISISDKSDENKQRNENNSNETSIEKSNESINNCSENELSTKPKIIDIVSQKDEHDNGKNNAFGNTGNARTADAADEKLQQHETSNSNETGNESVKIVYERSAIGPFAKPGTKNKVAAIIEHGASKPSLIKEENDNHLDKESENQDNEEHKGKDIEDTKYKVDESIELQSFKTKL